MREKATVADAHPHCSVERCTPDFDLALDDAVMAPLLARRIGYACSAGDASQDAQALELLLLYAALSNRRDAEAAGARAEVERAAHQISVSAALQDVVFGKTNIASTAFTGVGAAYAAGNRKQLYHLLQLDESTKRRLLSWASRPGVGIKSARVHFPDLHIAKVNGRWVFELERKPIPLYRITDAAAAERVARVRIGRGATIEDLSRYSTVTHSGMKASRVGGVLTHTGLGGAIALGPQAIFDAIDAGGVNRDFARRQAYSQPANVAGFAAGTVALPVLRLAATRLVPGAAAMFVGAGAVPIILAGFAIGAGVQYVVGYVPIGGRTISQRVGDFVTGGDRPSSR